MADISKLVPHILQWEGGFVNDPLDKGGATKYGVTLDTWKAVGKDKDGDGDIDSDDIKILSVDDFMMVLKKYYWDRWQADRIDSQSIANFLVDWVYNSGSYGIKIPQKLLGVDDDGDVGDLTIEAINKAHPYLLFLQLTDARREFVHDIVKNNPKQARFLQGWLNRINTFKFEK